MNGKAYSRSDKQALFDAYVAEGRHVSEEWPYQTKSCRVIAEELGQLWSHETIRKKLKKLGVELDEEVEFPGGYKPYGGEQLTEDELAEEQAQEAEDSLRHFGAVFPDLPAWRQRRLLRIARELVEALEAGGAVDLSELFGDPVERQEDEGDWLGLGGGEEGPMDI